MLRPDSLTGELLQSSPLFLNTLEDMSFAQFQVYSFITTKGRVGVRQPQHAQIKHIQYDHILYCNKYWTRSFRSNVVSKT